MQKFFRDTQALTIKQVKEFFEIAIDWETANKYKIYDKQAQELGFAAERNTGFLHSLLRNFLRKHRPMTIDVWDKEKRHVLIGRRPFFFFFSDLEVSDYQGMKVGEIKTRFGILKRKYDLLDASGHVFARIESFRWQLWTFKVIDSFEKELGVISKKWSGILKEAFTDSDNFSIDFSKKAWTPQEKAILLFATLMIDLDFFEDNSSSVGDIT